MFLSNTSEPAVSKLHAGQRMPASACRATDAGKPGGPREQRGGPTLPLLAQRTMDGVSGRERA
eukprot:4584603-Alexandrium_andersonii.AAC.1